MKRTFYVRIPAEQVSAGISSVRGDGLGCPLTVSDEPWQGDLNVTDPEAVTPERITAAARRKLGLPLIIGETERLVLREFCMEDLEALRAVHFTQEELFFLGPEAEKLKDADYLQAYIGTQYRFFEYGIWGVFLKKAADASGEKENGEQHGSGEEPDRGAGRSTVEKSVEQRSIAAEPENDGSGTSAALAGMIGFAPGDCPAFGIYTLRNCRRRGYGEEAGRAAFAYAREELGFEEAAMVIRRENRPSRALAEKLKTSLPRTEGRFLLHITIL